jgi:hypothetical protein
MQSMIGKPTVFILGAGASYPYGFPLGAELLATAYGHLATDSHQLHRRLVQCGFDNQSISLFRDAIPRAQRQSVDSLVASRPDLNEIGKAALAALLIDLEKENQLNPYREPAGTQPERAARRWYEHFIGAVFPRQPQDLAQNRCAFVTFNFDRSLERALHHALTANYVGDDAVARCREAFPIVHIHGELGSPTWMLDASATAEDAGSCRDYECPEAGLAGALTVARNRLSLVSDEIPPERKLGFGN